MSSIIPQLPQASTYEPNIDIQKIQPNYRFDVENMPKVQCYFHSNNNIKYFCKNHECLMPLCQECVQLHMLQNHQQTQSNIVPYEALLSEIYQNVAQDCNEMCDQIIRIQQLTEKNMTDKLVGRQSLQTNPIKLIDSARDQVITIVNNYFDTLKTYLQTQVNEPIPEIDVKPALQDLRIKWEANIKDLEFINSPQASIEKVIEYCEEQIRQRNDRTLNDADRLIKLLESRTPDYRQYGIDIPQLFVDPSFLPRFLWVLERYAFFRHPDEQPKPMEIIHQSQPPMYDSYIEPLPGVLSAPPPIYAPPTPIYGPPLEPYNIVREPIIIREPVFKDNLLRDDNYYSDFEEDRYQRERYYNEDRNYGRGRRRPQYQDENDGYYESNSKPRQKQQSQKKSNSKSTSNTKTKVTKTIEDNIIPIAITRTSKGPRELIIRHDIPTNNNLQGVSTTNFQTNTYQNPQYQTSQINLALPSSNVMTKSAMTKSQMGKSKLSSAAYTKS